MNKRSSFLEAKNLRLCTLTKEDFGEKMQTWINDKEVTQFLFRGILPAHPEALNAEYEQSKNQNSDIQLAIVDAKSGAYLGIVGLHTINWFSRHTEFRILIGDKSYWGKGYGAEACQLIVSYAFEALNMNKVWLGVNADNKRAHDSYLKCGFKTEGILRQELYRNNKYYDVVRMSLLKVEYLKIKKDWSVYKWIKKNYSA